MLGHPARHVTGDIRRNGLSRNKSLSVAYDADLVAAVVGAADGTAERDAIGCIAANERVLHVEVRVGDSELGRPLQLHALCRVFRQEPVRTVEHFRGEVGRYVEHVQVAGAEHQYLRI